jgi:hypothetical protein
MNNADTFRAVFRPARNGSGLMCRLPNGKVAFPSRYFWNTQPPQPYEIWSVQFCGETDCVAYVKPLQRLAEAPLGQSKAARIATRGLLSIATLCTTLARLLRPRLAPGGRP